MERLIKSYVKAVLKHLPILDRRKARAIITATIYERLEEYTDGLRPIRKDVKAVLREMGRPSAVARAYYEDFHKPLFRVPQWSEISEQAVQSAMILAYALVCLGLVQLLMGSGHAGCLVFGAVIGILTQFYTVVCQVKKEYSVMQLEKQV